MVHEYLASQDFAPKLLYFGPLANQHFELPAEQYGCGSHSINKYMVVMEYLDDEGLSFCQSAADDLQIALTRLHISGYVFGDLRFANLVVLKKGGRVGIKLIDFNWTGSYNTEELHLTHPVPLPIWQYLVRMPKPFLAPLIPANISPYTHYPLNLNKEILDFEDLSPIFPWNDWALFDKLVLFAKLPACDKTTMPADALRLIES